MFTRVLSPRRPHAEPVFGTCLSLAAHGAIVASLVVVPDAPLTRTESPGALPEDLGERLHWVGVSADQHGAPAAGRPGEKAPLAYVIPGRNGALVHVRGMVAPRPRTDRTRTKRSGRSDGEEPAAKPSRTPVAPRLRLAPLPDVTLPDPDATLVMAGVLASSSDLARRVSRPEDFAPAPGRSAMSELVMRAVIGTTQGFPSEGVRAVPIPLVGNRPPLYPVALERANIGGRVLVEFTIDSTGAVDPGTLRILQSSHALFTEAVRNALPRLRFLPAQLGEHAVRVTVRQPFLFRVKPGRAGP